MAPLALAIPLWARHRLTHREATTRASRLLDVTIVTLAATRLLGDALPLSGHMLFLSYSALTTRSPLYAGLAVLLLVETTAFKFYLWHDPLTWALGLVGGVAAAGFYRWLTKRPHLSNQRLHP